MTPVPSNRWGRDHWSLLAYIETVCVDQHGMVELRRMRCDIDRHPQFSLQEALACNCGFPAPKKYPTLLRDSELPDHDDWDCLDDLEAAGLVENIGFTMQPRYAMTNLGSRVVSELRRHKARGGCYRDFTPTTPPET